MILILVDIPDSIDSDISVVVTVIAVIAVIAVVFGDDNVDVDNNIILNQGRGCGGWH